MNVKTKPYRSQEYLRFVRGEDCCKCFSSGGNDAHHVSGLNAGMGTKNSDMTCISLCRACHTLFHSGNLDVDEFYYLARTIQNASDRMIIDVA